MTATATLLATALVFSPVNATPPPTYFLGGTDFTGTGIVTDADIAWLLDGHLTGATNVPYPRAVTGMDGSIAVGADAIVDIADEAPAPVRIAGISQGAMAIAAAKRELMARDEADRPAPEDLTFVSIGDPTSPTGIGGRLPGLHIPFIDVTFTPAPETPYDTVVVTREYDGLADFPDRPLNLVSTLNAVAGVVYIHPTSYGPDTDLEEIPDEDVTETVNSLGGKTTTYFIQNDRLPLLQPLRDMKVDERIVEAIEKPLEQVVDAGYSRNDAKPAKDDDDSADEKDQKDEKKDDKRQDEAEKPGKADTTKSDTGKADTKKDPADSDSAKAA
jgi:hypothetical protein